MALIGDGMRFAIIKNADRTASQVQPYMPANYEASSLHDGTVIISGHDNAGWTLDGYVIPRLASGMIIAVELQEVRQ